MGGRRRAGALVQKFLCVLAMTSCRHLVVLAYLNRWISAGCRSGNVPFSSTVRLCGRTESGDRGQACTTRKGLLTEARRRAARRDPSSTRQVRRPQQVL